MGCVSCCCIACSSIPNSRTPQFIINLSENGKTLDGVGVTGLRPFGVVVSGAPAPAPGHETQG